MNTLRSLSLVLFAAACAAPSGEVVRHDAPVAVDIPTMDALGLHGALPCSKEYRPGGQMPCGVCIGRVDPGSRAARAGLRSGDVISEVEGEPTWHGGIPFDQAVPTLQRLLRARRGPIRVTVIRFHRNPIAEGYGIPFEERVELTL